MTSAKGGGVECEGTIPRRQGARDEEHSHASGHKSCYTQHHSCRNVLPWLCKIEEKGQGDVNYVKC